MKHLRDEELQNVVGGLIERHTPIITVGILAVFGSLAIRLLPFIAVLGGRVPSTGGGFGRERPRMG